MHIAFFSDQHPATLGGLQVSLGLQREFLERAGHTVTVCAPATRRTPSRRYSRDDDVLLRSTQVGEHSFCLAGLGADRATDQGFADRPPVDVVHVQADVWGAWNGYRFARRHGLPVVHTMHTNVEVGLPAIMPFPRTVFRLLFGAHQRFMRAGPVRDIAGYVRVFADTADALIAPSTHFVDQLRGYGVTRPIHVIPTGVDDSRIDALLREPATRRTRPVLVWPGRVSQEKRLDELIQAFALSRIDADLHVYGAGPDLSRCRGRVEQLGVRDRVRFLGAVSHDAVLRAIRDADALVQSSIGYETQGLTVYEAIALGTPVLVRDPAIARGLPSPWCHRVEGQSVNALAGALRTLDRKLTSAGRAETAPFAGFRQTRLTERVIDVYRRARAEHAADFAARAEAEYVA